MTCSRNGCAEQDLLEIVGINQAIFARLYNGIWMHLRPRSTAAGGSGGGTGRRSNHQGARTLALYQRQLAEAVYLRYVRGQPARLHESYNKLAQYFHARADPSYRNLWSMPSVCTDDGVGFVAPEIVRNRRRSTTSHARMSAQLRHLNRLAGTSVVGRTFKSTMEISVARAIADVTFYYLAATRLGELTRMLTCLRWIQARLLLESTLGGMYGIIGLVNDFQLSAEQITKFRGTILRREGVDRQTMLRDIRDFLILIRCQKAILCRHPTLVSQNAFNQPEGSGPRKAAESLLRQLQLKKYDERKR